MGLLLLVALLGLLQGTAWAAQPAKGVFETCPACRLSAMPELKRFLMHSIMKNEYDRLSVKFIFGKTPTLILYDDAGKEMSATEVDPALNFDALHKWVQGMGFVKQAPTGDSMAATPTAGAAAAVQPAAATPTALLPNVQATTGQAATASTQAIAAATTTAAAAGAAGSTTPPPAAPGGPAPIPAQPEQLLRQQQLRRRRQRRRRMRQQRGQTPGGNGQQQQHRRQRQPERRSSLL